MFFWNCNGLGDPKKFKFLSDLTLEKNLDFIALSETGRESVLRCFSKPCAVGRISFGMSNLQGAGPEVCCWGLIFSCLTLEK